MMTASHAVNERMLLDIDPVYGCTNELRCVGVKIIDPNKIQDLLPEQAQAKHISV